MPHFTILETDDGLTVAELSPGVSPSEVAVKYAGVVVDPGPYTSYDEAYDAILAILYEEAEDDRQ